MREIAFDTETTGLDPASGHRIIELGCVEMVDKIRTGRAFQSYLNPQRDVPPEAQAVHGLSSAFLLDKPLFAEVVEAFLEFIGDSTLVIHNAGFDLKFINAELEKVGFATIPAARAVDTVGIARRKFPGSPASLDALCKRFNIDLSSRSKHGALLDAELLADVYLELCGGRQASIQLFDNTKENAEALDKRAGGEVAALPARLFKVSAQELEAHRAQLSRLKNPLWEKYSVPEDTQA